MTQKIDAKFEKNTKTDLWFGKWQEKFGKLSPEHLKVSKLGLWSDTFVQSQAFIQAVLLMSVFEQRLSFGIL